jgi:hypothetical protein
MGATRTDRETRAVLFVNSDVAAQDATQPLPSFPVGSAPVRS